MLCIRGLDSIGRAVPLPALADAGLRRAVEKVLPIARRKLMDADCRMIFLEFRDRSGRPLLQKLEALGKIPAEYLMELGLRDGGADLCRRPGVLAASVPGAGAVHLCGRRFEALALRHPGYAANILIHEQLHALGLEENPPSSEEITYRIALRCGW